MPQKRYHPAPLSSQRRRFSEQNSVSEKWELIYYEAYKVKTDALLREKRLKYYGKALGQLKQRIKYSLDMNSKVRGKGEKAR